MMKAKVIIFDLDDTLISEKDYIESGYRHISQILSERLDKNKSEVYELLYKLLNESPNKVFNRLFDKMDVSYSRNTILELVEEYRNHIPKIIFYDDVLPSLKLLKSRDIKTGIITDGYANAQRQKLKAVGAINYFHKIIVTDELGREYWKPHPKSFEIMKETFDVEYDEIVYVGDNPKKDFYISSVYPIQTIRIRRENGVYTTNEYYKNIKENISISTLKEVIESLNI